MTMELTLQQQNEQLKFAVEMMEMDYTGLKDIDSMLKIVLDNLIDNRVNLLKIENPTMEEILLQECRSRLFHVLEST